MASLKQIEANRRNAKRSTGPRSAFGKSRARANSVRHGLLSKVLADPGLVAEKQELATRIAREHGKPDDVVEARTIADTELTILTARAIRARLLDSSLSSQTTGGSGCSSPDSKQADPSRNAPGNFDLALAYLRLGPTLATLDRYEQRAISRRQRAARHLFSDK